MKSKNGPARTVISPCLLVESIEDELQFLKTVFDAIVLEGTENEKSAWQAEARLGDSTVMIGRAGTSDSPAKSVVYVWTDDVDGTYGRALQAERDINQRADRSTMGRARGGFPRPTGLHLVDRKEDAQDVESGGGGEAKASAKDPAVSLASGSRGYDMRVL